MAFSHDAPPLPGRAVIAQRWSRALFLHWRADAARLAPLLPPGVRPDVFDGSGWIGLVPFVLSKFQFLPAPPVPFLGTFNEINVRTYGIDDEGRRGVVFLTLEAEHLIPVLTANVEASAEVVADGVAPHRRRAELPFGGNNYWRGKLWRGKLWRGTLWSVNTLGREHIGA